MKNQYFGDVNDYLKYGLLRCFAETGWNVGVCWMLTPNDGRADGRKTKYLTHPAKWRDFDPVLFDTLGAAVSAGCRSIEQIESQPAMIPGAGFFSKVVPEQARSRDAWFSDVSMALATSDLLFFDPDNGMEVASTSYGRKNSCKFLYWRELCAAWDNGFSILIFQHFPRLRRSDFAAGLADKLGRELTGSLVATLQSSNVLYLLAVRSEHRTRMRDTLELIMSRWGSLIR